MHNYFCGWYFKCQSNSQTIALIPAYHETNGQKSCSLQIITKEKTWNLPFLFSQFRQELNHFSIHLSDNTFSENGIKLNVHTKDFHAVGNLKFSKFTPIRYDIMGIFRFVPFMECRHSILSMQHYVNGKLKINGQDYLFQNALGYIEGDRGYSFPKNYVWTQCHFHEGSLMLSVADIPLSIVHFTGIIAVVFWKGKEYRLATYLGAKLVHASDGTIVIRQGKYTLTAQLLEKHAHALSAPCNGAMSHTIRENPCCHARYCFQKDGETLFEFKTKRAAFEYEMKKNPSEG